MEKDESVVSLFFRYLYEHLKMISMLVIFELVNVVILYLYNISVEPVLYSIVLISLAAVIYLVINFIIYYRKHMALKNLRNTIADSIEEIPRPATIIEKDYQELIDIINDYKSTAVSKADMDKSQLVEYCTMWAHQIKTPIAAMQLYLQCNGSDEDKELYFELFKIEQYVEMILQYIRMQDMSGDMRFEEYDLLTIVRAAVKKYAKVFIRKKINLNLDEFDVKVLTDDKWVSFVIEQVISNALKYTKEGSISIYMDSRRFKTLVIEDTGIGIAEDDLPRVFEKGFTGYNGRADKKSTGIGLYLCREIIKKLSHRIWIESEPGKGTKVFIDFEALNLEVD